jgi:hypothetical protein
MFVSPIKSLVPFKLVIRRKACPHSHVHNFLSFWPSYFFGISARSTVRTSVVMGACILRMGAGHRGPGKNPEIGN